jgi:hypothetical protein
MIVKLTISLATAEAITHFLAERKELWTRHALDFGVTDPTDLPRQLAAIAEEEV